MRVSNRLNYAVRALLELALRSGEGPIPARDIARRQDIPDAFAHQVLGSLAKAGFVRTSRGPGGGHTLGRPAERISLLDVVESVEGAPEDTQGDSDVVSRLWRALEDQQRAYLAGWSLADLAQEHREAEGVVLYSI